MTRIREAIRTYLRTVRVVRSDPGQIVIVSGPQQAFGATALVRRHGGVFIGAIESWDDSVRPQS